jgi:hypothetical protein
MAKEAVKKGSTVVLVGTQKGGFVFHSGDRRKWSRLGPYMAGMPVYHMVLDPRDGRTVYAGAPNPGVTWGPAVFRGRLGGAVKATREHPKFREGSDLAMTRVWHLEPGPPNEPETVYAGIEPAALFRSDDRGDSWTDFPGLNYHETRAKWNPGNGGLCAHSVLVDPRKPRHLLVGISSVGTFESRDGGDSWTMENQGVRAGFLPNQYPEYGQCVHHLTWDSSRDGSIFHQNHSGTYWRGSDGGRWTEVTKGLPSDFGFAIASHAHKAHSAFVIPLIGGENRVPPKNQLAVWRTSNAGKSWRRLTKGLPADAYMGVLREGLATDEGDPLGVYFGTNTGQLYASRDEGVSWKAINTNFPPITSVSTGVAR